MSIDPELVRKMQNPKNWPGYKPAIIAHDVARSRDRSTAVLGGVCPFDPRIVGIEAAYELPRSGCSGIAEPMYWPRLTAALAPATLSLPT